MANRRECSVSGQEVTKALFQHLISEGWMISMAIYANSKPISIIQTSSNEYYKERGDTAVKRVILTENINHPMFGDEYFKRTQYSADLIHQHAMDWLKAQTKDKPFFIVFVEEVWIIEMGLDWHI